MHPPTSEKVARRYRFEEQLGTGATSTVWRAHDTEQDTDVAIKLLHPHLVDDPVARQRMQDEATSAARLSHPGVLRVLATSISDSEAAVVFPFVEGQTLASRLASPATRPNPRRSAEIVADVADALACAHKSGVVHRDVKPSNILIGANGRALLLDFGISAPASPTTDLTGTGMAIGTLPYMSPEQLHGGPAEPPTDVFSLGAVLYEMLQGRRPFPASTAVAVAEQHRQPPPPMAGAPGPLVQLTLAALAYDPGARPSAAEFARSARAWLAGRSDEALTVVVPAPAVGIAESTVVLPAPAVQPGVASRGARGRRVIAGFLIGGLALAVMAALAFGMDWSGLVAAGPSGSPAPSTSAEPTTQPTETPGASPSAEPPLVTNQTEVRSDNKGSAPKDGGGKHKKHKKHKH